MARIIHHVHTSVDGFVDGPGEFDWPVMGPELSAYSLGLAEGAGTLLYGRVVWGWMSGYWPDAESVSDDPHDLAFAPIWRRTPKLVVSRTLDDPGHGATLAGSVAEVAEYKRRADGDLVLLGGYQLADALTAQGLIDEYHVVVHPVLLGGGHRLFPADRPRVPLRLGESRVLDGQTVLTVHHRD